MQHSVHPRYFPRMDRLRRITEKSQDFLDGVGVRTAVLSGQLPGQPHQVFGLERILDFNDLAFFGHPWLGLLRRDNWAPFLFDDQILSVPGLADIFDARAQGRVVQLFSRLGVSMDQRHFLRSECLQNPEKLRGVGVGAQLLGP